MKYGVTRRRRYLLASSCALVAGLPNLAYGASLDASPQTTPSAPASDQAAPANQSDTSGLPDIIVTAQKRSENINNVPLTVSLVTGDDLVSKGITDPSELVRAVPGLVYAKSAWSAPVYTLRGVGFYDNSLSAVPAVTVYVDQAPLPYSALTTFATLDVKRVEVLKGPQGTLYGESSTGGAINYISNRPTDQLSAGLDFSFGRFNDATTDAYVSGPLSDTLKARLSIHNETSGDWQRSLTRPGDTLGSKQITMGRILLDWKPATNLTVRLNANFGLNRSEPQAPQFQTINPDNAFAWFVASTFHPRFLTYPSANGDARNADWDAGRQLRLNTRQYQGALSIDYDIGGTWTLSSITSYVRLKQDSRLDADGTDLLDLPMRVTGTIDSFYQELRAQGTTLDGKLKLIGGLNYERNHVVENVQANIIDSYLGTAIVGFGLNTGRGNLHKTSLSGYINGDYALTDKLSLTAGVRYSNTKFHYENCTTADDATTATSASGIVGFPIAIGECFTLTPAGTPGVTTYRNSENNVPWRVALQFKPTSGNLLYASVSSGFKSGTYPDIAATTFQSNGFVKQESIIAYEAGFKSSLIARTLQLNGAVFYYDYKNKQVLGSEIDPKLGSPLNVEINVPSARVLGAELELSVAPARGLTFSASATYLDSKITGSFVNVDFVGATRQLAGYALPYAPRISVVGQIDYKFTISNGWEGYVGSSAHYQSSTNAGLGGDPLAHIDGYYTVDAQLGIQNDRFRIGIWGRNLTNKYYWNTVFMPIDTIARYAGQPISYGISAGYHF